MKKALSFKKVARAKSNDKSVGAKTSRSVEKAPERSSRKSAPVKSVEKKSTRSVKKVVK